MDLFYSIESEHAKQQISQQCPMSNRTRVHTHTMGTNQVQRNTFLFLFIESKMKKKKKYNILYTENRSIVLFCS